MSLTLRHLYKFDSFIVDVNQRVLFRDGRMVPLTPKVFETLLLLVENQGSIVTKERMLATLWPDVFVEESNVTFNITMLRKALGDSKQSSVYIETVPRRGYRFKTEVSEVLEKDPGDGTHAAELAFARNGKSDAMTSSGESEPAAELARRTTINTFPHSASLIRGKQIGLVLSVLVVIVSLGGVAIWRFNRHSVHAGAP